MTPDVRNGILIFDKWQLNNEGILTPNNNLTEFHTTDYVADAGNSESITNIVDETRNIANRKYNNLEKSNEIALVLDEAMRNHAKHSLQYRKGEQIITSLFIYDDSLSAVVRSIGEKFDPLKALESYRTASNPLLYKDSGRGIFLMEHYSDKLIIVFDEKQQYENGFMTQTGFKKKMN